jgi:DNA polymerase-3 subunit gamma/tau
LPSVAASAAPAAASSSGVATSVAPTIAPAASLKLDDAEDWMAVPTALSLRGPVRELAAHTAVLGRDDGVLRLAIAPGNEHLKSDSLVRQLAQAVGQALGVALQVRFEAAPAQAAVDTLHDRTQRQRSERQSGAEADFFNDPVVSRLLEQGATLVPDSIRPRGSDN